MSKTDTYTVAVAKTATSMAVTTAPPSSMAPYTLFTFAGYLVDAQGTRLSGKTVTLYDGGSAVGNVTTASDGTWSWPLSRAPGTYTFYANFPGDSTSSGSSTSTYTVAVSTVATSMVVTTAPPSSIASYTLFTFSGYLVDAQGTRLSGKTVTLYDGGSAVGNVTTASDGTWGWSLSRAPGTYTFYVQFAGDSTYAGC